MRRDKKEPKQIDRRRLLQGAGLAIGAAGAASAAAAKDSSDIVTDDNQRRAGYRETESVKTYYRIARF